MSDTTNEFRLHGTAAAQFSYHVRMSAVFAVAGRSDDCASESVLAWTILGTCCPDAIGSATTTATELVGQDQVSLSAQHREAAEAKARSQALDLQGHFESTGQHDVAALYAQVAEELPTTIAHLTPRP